jgi:hypothetical protein
MTRTVALDKGSDAFTILLGCPGIRLFYQMHNTVIRPSRNIARWTLSLDALWLRDFIAVPRFSMANARLLFGSNPKADGEFVSRSLARRGEKGVEMN